MGISISHSTSGEGVLEQLELVIASDERRDRDPGRRASVRADCRPGPNSLLASAQVHRPDLVDFDSTEREPVGRRPHEDLARLCDLL